MNELTDKQKMFVDEYLIDLNATQAAIRAGYSEKTARQQGQRLLTNVNIRKAIDERMSEKRSHLIMQQNEILARLSRIARREEPDHQVILKETPIYDDKDNFKGIEKTPEIVETPTRNRDTNKALELLGKRYGMWTDRHEVEHKLPTIIDDVPEEDE